MTADSIERYRRLVAESLPRVITSDEEHERVLAILAKRFHRSDLPEEEATLAELLTHLVEHYESQRFQLHGSTPVSRLRMLMEEHGLRQADLLDVFGSRGIASEVVSGKRGISKTQAVRLARRFGVTAGLFLAAD